MRYGRYRIRCRLKDDALLPPYQGSTLRGLLGHALKRVVCTLKHQECGQCLLREKCVYAFFFHTPDRGDAPSPAARMAAPPKPYVLEPPQWGQSDYKSGDILDFSILLFGRANEYLPYLIYAFKHMGSLGIGKKVQGRRAQYDLEQVFFENRCIYTAETDRLLVVEPLGLRLTDPMDSGQAASAIHIDFETPLRVKFKNSFSAELPFHLLVRTVLRRISSLEAVHGPGEPDLDYRGLVARAEGIRVRENGLRWFDWPRYSARQDQKMLMGGLVGRMVYAGELSEFLPLLRFGEEVHIGKQTSFGLGRYRIIQTSGEA